VAPLPEATIAAVPSKRSQPRVAFASVVEAGLVEAGETLVDERKRHRALVRADGTLALAGSLAIVGSIHKIGALAQGLPACNGWTFWHTELSGQLAPIDELRATIRENLKTAAE
ncbi:MAG: modification methylase, partial [Methylovirgula sp.]